MTNFVSGLYYSQPNTKAPEYVLANISVKPLEFIAWLSEQKQNEKGYVRIVVKKSQKGTIYAALDDWEPKKKFMTEHQGDNMTDNIPDDFFEGK